MSQEGASSDGAIESPKTSAASSATSAGEISTESASEPDVPAMADAAAALSGAGTVSSADRVGESVGAVAREQAARAAAASARARARLIKRRSSRRAPGGAASRRSGGKRKVPPAEHGGMYAHALALHKRARPSRLLPRSAPS